MEPEGRKQLAIDLAQRGIVDVNDRGKLAELSIELAATLLERANELMTPAEKRQQVELDRMIQRPADKSTLMQLTDQAFRSNVPHRAADQLVHVLDIQGIPRFFSPFERTLLKGFHSFGNYLPGVAVPLVKTKMRQETANVILPAEKEHLATHLAERRDEGVRMNVNHLGEALLGERQAQNRLRGYLDLLRLPEIEVISVKISTIFSQISNVAHRWSVHKLSERLELLYRAAQRERFRTVDGREVPKFVYLDMEEYRDMELTADLFMSTLDKPGLEQASAGIALQAYVPDSAGVQRRLNAWARDRVQRGRAPVTIRIVKGANMEMERVEASHRGWPQAPFKEKWQTDANYKRMLLEGFQSENLAAVRLGVASHNLLDVAFAVLLTARSDAWGSVQFEMLEGMANHQRRALFEVVDNLLLYAPACYQSEFIHAIAYLVRRLDENTGEENFLRHTFRLAPGDDAWHELADAFTHSFQRIDDLTSEPRRAQNRTTECPPTILDDRELSSAEEGSVSETSCSETLYSETRWLATFDNAADTDFCLSANVAWAEAIREAWMPQIDERAWCVPIRVCGGERWESREVGLSPDPSRPDSVACRFAKATTQDVVDAVAYANAEASWSERTWEERGEILGRVAERIRVRRGDLIGAAMLDAGKTVIEADPEVSEAIDFVEYYRRAALQWATERPSRTVRPMGIVAVVSPWNFPIAIPCGGIAAALAAGNRVLLKPASDTVLPAYILCQCFWEAGVPPSALQFVPGSGATAGQAMVTHENVDAVILTGGTETALRMMAAKPDVRLFAETGGKNATVVTALSDRDQAIKHVVQSAFGHSGQKCSATSLLLLETEVFNDSSFREALCDAVESMLVGSVWELHNRIGPLIRPPSGELERGLKELEVAEEWAVLPQQVDGNPHLYSPGIKWNVQPESFTHLTEFFGPLLGVMPVRSLDEAIYRVNSTGYGLTSGLESLDDREVEAWTEGIQAGNLYVNRSTTGAIVHRQPFGGMGKSSFGAGMKAGGPNYVSQFMRFRDATHPPAPRASLKSDYLRDLLRRATESIGELPGVDDALVEQLGYAFESFEAAVAEEFHLEHDDFRLVGQDNIRRYLPVHELRIRLQTDDDPLSVFLRIGAAAIAGCRPAVVSRPETVDDVLWNRLERWTESWGATLEFVFESDEELAAVVANSEASRIRFASAVPNVVRLAAVESGVFLADSPIATDGRLELMSYFREQSLSVDYHRYGNLGPRSDEVRRPID